VLVSIDTHGDKNPAAAGCRCPQWFTAVVAVTAVVPPAYFRFHPLGKEEEDDASAIY